jgi:hypothetical protein
MAIRLTNQGVVAELVQSLLRWFGDLTTEFAEVFEEIIFGGRSGICGGGDASTASG